jgi:hypothetical protein
MWFVRGKPTPWIGAHSWCRCGRRWRLVGVEGELVPFDPADTGPNTVGKSR